jgi:hypothetical protein
MPNKARWSMKPISKHIPKHNWYDHEFAGCAFPTLGPCPFVASSSSTATKLGRSAASPPKQAQGRACPPPSSLPPPPHPTLLLLICFIDVGAWLAFAAHPLLCLCHWSHHHHFPYTTVSSHTPRRDRQEFCRPPTLTSKTRTLQQIVRHAHIAYTANTPEPATCRLKTCTC